MYLQQVISGCIILLFYFISFLCVHFSYFDIFILSQSVGKRPIRSFCIGDSHACSVFDNRKLKCWGLKSSLGSSASSSIDVLGDKFDETGDYLPYMDVGNGFSIIRVSCGFSHLCIQADSGDTKCIGNNNNGQIGIGSSLSTIGVLSGHVGDSLPIVKLGDGLKVLDVSAGYQHTCFKISGNKIKCIGQNNVGQLGLGDKTNRGISLSQMGNSLPFVNLGVGYEVLTLYSGSSSNFNCVTFYRPANAAQKIKCWGEGTSYQLGYNDPNNKGDQLNELGDNLPFVDLGSVSKVKQLALGYSHVCALLISDSMKCWGTGLSGQLGSGSIGSAIAVGDNLPNIPIDGGKTISSVMAGDSHTCISYTDDTTVKCFGLNFYGQLGQGDKMNRGNSLATRISNIPVIDFGIGSLKILNIYSGSHSSCAIFTDFTVKCFGRNDRGQCLTGSLSNGIGDSPGEMGSNLSYAMLISSPTLNPTMNPTMNITPWPTTFIPTQIPTTNPTFPPFPKPQVTSFCAGGNHACALFSGLGMKCWGNIAAWGLASYGKIGESMNTIGDNIPFITLSPLLSVTAVACGYEFNCALLSSGDIKCLGSNMYGQIGIGSAQNRIGQVSGHVGDNLPIVKLGNGVKAIDMALGYHHACILLTNKKVKCYGYNFFGQLGQGHNQDIGKNFAQMAESLPYVDIGINLEVISIFAGSTAHHNCVSILSMEQQEVNGRFKCWGRNTYYQLGYGVNWGNNIGDGQNEMGDNLQFVDLGTESRIRTLSLGSRHTCALLINEALKCWGGGSYGQLASGSSLDITTTGNSLPFVQLDPGRNVKLISTGFWHTCIVYEDLLTMKCFGDNIYGQLGQGDTITRGNSMQTIIPNIHFIYLGTEKLRLQKIISGESFNCILLPGGLIKCFGDNDHGQLAIGSTSRVGDSPDEMESNLKFSVLFSPPTTSPTIQPSLAPTFPTSSPTDSPTFTPTKAPFLQNVATYPIEDFQSGGKHACAVFKNGLMKCWGSSASFGMSEGAIGDSLLDLENNLHYINIGNPTFIKSVACGNLHTCVLLDNGNAKCLGNNAFGQLGLGLSINFVGTLSGHIGNTLPLLNIGNNLPIIGIAAGSQHTCLRTSGNKVKCVGDSTYGQIGYGGRTQIGKDPSKLGNNLPFIYLGKDIEVNSIHSGHSSFHTCVIVLKPSESFQRIKCWGRNDNNQLGYGDVINRGDSASRMGDSLSFVDLGAESRVAQISLGGRHTCVLLVNDLLKCFGSASYGQLASGASIDIKKTGDLIPFVQFDQNMKVKSINLGSQHSCIVYDDEATMKCVGNAKYGQLGQGNSRVLGISPSSMIPAFPAIDLGVGSLKIKSISCGELFTCVIFYDSSVKCFGYNADGQLAIGTNKNVGVDDDDMGSNLLFAKMFAPTTYPTKNPSYPTLSPTQAPSRRSTNKPSKQPQVLNVINPKILSFCVGFSHACAVFETQQSKCWGLKSSFGYSTLLGGASLGDSMDDLGSSLPFVHLGSETKIQQVFCGSSHTCFRTSKNDLRCVGNNSHGQTGQGVTINQVNQNDDEQDDNIVRPINIGEGLYVLDVALGYYHTCVLLSTKKVKCFGNSLYGQLGYENKVSIGKNINDMGTSLPYVNFGTEVEVKSIHSGPRSDYTCVILLYKYGNDQRIKCWGINSSSQLGYGDLNHRGDSIGEMGDNLPLVDLGSESRVKQLTIGLLHYCALMINYRVKCRGIGSFGQLGSGSKLTISSTGDSIPFLLLDPGNNVLMIQAGLFHTCIVYEDRIIMKCVGDNLYGQLGQSDKVGRGATPTTIIPNIPPIDFGTGSPMIFSIHSGGDINCVVFVDFSVKCFGYNYYGQCLVGSSDNIGKAFGEMGNGLKSAMFFAKNTISPTTLPSLQYTTIPTSLNRTESPTISPSSLNRTESPTAKIPIIYPSLIPTASPEEIYTAKPSSFPTIATYSPSPSPTLNETWIPTAANSTS